MDLYFPRSRLFGTQLNLFVVSSTPLPDYSLKSSKSVGQTFSSEALEGPSSKSIGELTQPCNWIGFIDASPIIYRNYALLSGQAQSSHRSFRSSFFEGL